MEEEKCLFLRNKCMGLNANIKRELGVHTGIEAFKDILFTDEALTLDMHIQWFCKQLSPFPLLKVTANDQIVVVHGIQHLVIPLVQMFPLKNQIPAFSVNDAQGFLGFLTFINLMKISIEAANVLIYRSQWLLNMIPEDM